jgi:hypothetical protein
MKHGMNVMPLEVVPSLYGLISHQLQKNMAVMPTPDARATVAPQDTRF